MIGKPDTGGIALARTILSKLAPLAVVLTLTACAPTEPPRTIPGIVDRIERPANVAVVETLCTVDNGLPCVMRDVPLSELPADVREGQTVEVTP